MRQILKSQMLPIASDRCIIIINNYFSYRLDAYIDIEVYANEPNDMAAPENELHFILKSKKPSRLWKLP